MYVRAVPVFGEEATSGEDAAAGISSSLGGGEERVQGREGHNQGAARGQARLEKRTAFLKKQVARKKGLSGDEPQEEDHSELKLAEARHTLMRENKALLRRISESRHVLNACKTSPCLEALDDDQRQELQNTHEAWRATVQALLNASTRGDADRVRKLQALVRKLADSADIATGNTQLYFNQAEKIIEASDDILDAVLARKKLRTSTSTDEADVSDDPATILTP